MNVLEKIVKKQDELIRHLRLFALTNSTAPFTKQWNEKRTKIESELSSLKAMEGNQLPATDEDIEKYFTSQHYDNKNGHHYRVNKDRIFGAKAMRDGLIPASSKTQIKEQEKEATEIGFVRSGNCPDEIIWQGIEYVKKSSIIDYTCDACGCHPSVIINTPKGRFCQQHVQY